MDIIGILGFVLLGVAVAALGTIIIFLYGCQDTLDFFRL